MLRALKRRQAGVTLFEVLLVLFVAAFIAAAVGTIYSKVTLTYKQNQLQTGVQQLSANITATYGTTSAPDYGSADFTGAVIAGGLAPDDMHSTTTPINPWMTSGGWSVMGNGPYYTITLNGIPSAACSTMYPSLSKISNHQPIGINDGTASDAGTALGLCVEAENTIMLYVN